jgi:hypothetical protein
MTCFYNRDGLCLLCGTVLVFMLFCGSENKHRLFPYRALTDWFYNRDDCVYCAVRTKYLNIIRVNLCLRKLIVYKMTVAQWLLNVPPGLTLRNPTFCPHSVFMCFMWISEQTAIISLYRINWMVFITCLLRGMSRLFKKFSLTFYKWSI